MTAPVFVQANSAHEDTASGITLAGVAFDAPATNGNTILAMVKIPSQAIGGITVTDDASGGSNTYTLVKYIDGVAGNIVAIFQAENIHGAPSVVGANFASTGYPRISIAEYSGAATSGSVNDSEVNSQAAPGASPNAITSNDSGGTATTVADCLLVGLCLDVSAGTTDPTDGAGFTGDHSYNCPPNNYDCFRWSSKTQASPGPAHATFNSVVGGADTFITFMVALGPTTSGLTLTALPRAAAGTGFAATLTVSPVVVGEVADAEFVQFLAGPLAKTVLCNLEYGYDAGDDTPAVAIARFSNRRYSTNSTDAPASTPYRDVLRDAPTFSRQISRETLDGFASLTVSPIVFDSLRGDMDWLLDAVIDGYKVEFRLGFGGDDSEPWRPAWAYADFRRVFTAYMERAEISGRGEITVYVRGADALADKGVVGGSIVDMVSPVPICVGTVALISALEESHSTLLYRYADSGYLYSPHVSDVRDNGEPLGDYLSPTGFATYAAVSDSGGDRVEITGLIAWTIAVNDVMRIVGAAPSPLVSGDQYWVVDTDGSTWFELSATRGGSPMALTPGAIFNIFRQGYFDNLDGTMNLSAAPVGNITASVQNLTLPGGRADKFSDLYWWAWTVAAGLDEADFAGAHDSYAVGDGYLDDRNGGIVVQQRRNVIPIIDGIARSSASFCGSSLSGKFMFGRINTNPLDLPTTSSASFGDDSVLGDVQCTRLPPRYSAVATFAGLNYQPLTQIVEDPAISDKTRDRLKSKGQAYTVVEESGTSYDDAPSRWHRTMTRSPDFENLAMSAGASWPEFIRLRFAPHVEFLIFDAPFSKAYRLELGDKTTVYMPLFCGHTENTYWQVLGHSFQLLRGGLFQNSVGIQLVRRRVPSVELHGSDSVGGGAGAYLLESGTDVYLLENGDTMVLE